MDLTSVLTPEIMAPILANPEVQQRLMPYLPSGESLLQSTEELHNTLSSPQFQQVVQILMQLNLMIWYIIKKCK